MSAGIESFDWGPAFLAPAVAGLVGDLLYRRMRPSPERPWSMRAWAAVVPAALWLAYFGLQATFESVGWSVELWSGVIGMSAAAGFALALCVAPPPLPVAEPVPVAGAEQA